MDDFLLAVDGCYIRDWYVEGVFCPHPPAPSLTGEGEPDQKSLSCRLLLIHICMVRLNPRLIPLNPRASRRQR